MSREKNILDMTIREQIEEIKQQMCDSRCYYQHDKDIAVSQEELDEICDSCPLTRL